MQTQITPKSKSSPRTSLAPGPLVRQYVSHLTRMHMVAAQCQPGHPWFEHQMFLHQRASKTLREWIRSERHGKAVIKAVLTEATRYLNECGVEGPIRERILSSLGVGVLPLVNSELPI